MSLAQEFIDALNTDNSADADHAALIGSDGDALLVRYRGARPAMADSCTNPRVRVEQITAQFREPLGSELRSQSSRGTV